MSICMVVSVSLMGREGVLGGGELKDLFPQQEASPSA